MKAFFVVFFIFAFLGVGVYGAVVYLAPQELAPGLTAEDLGLKPAEEVLLPPPPDYAPSEFSWSIQPAPGSSDTNPEYFVNLTVKDRTISVGKFIGCTGKPSTASLEPGEVTRTSCWHAGAGTDISVFKEADRFYVKTRFVQEVPPDVEALSHGPFQTLFRID